MKPHYPLVIIGAGPAGLAAANTVAQHNIDVALLDEQATAGGQIYRSVTKAPQQRAQQLGEEYQRGRQLVEQFLQSNSAYFPNTSVWSLNRQKEIALVHDGKSRIIKADQILLASGALERPLPFPGWTLPGVMHAGAGQILFKSSGLIPNDGVVLAGSGPLLLLLAWQYLHAGVTIKALLDTTPYRNYLKALPKLPKALLAHHYISKGLFYQAEIVRAGIKTYFGISDLKAQGEQELQTVSFRHFGKKHTLSTPLLLSHFGVIPHIWLSQAAGCEHQWDNSQQCWRPQHDEWGNSSLHGILIAGDGAGIHGARSAEHAGNLAGFEILYKLGILSQNERDRQSTQHRQWMNAERHIRPFLENLYRIPENMLAVIHDQTIVCRCEEISAGEIRAALADRHDNSNQVKFYTRCGMGPCQGRQCANAVAHICHFATGKAMTVMGHYRGRPPVAPVTLGQLANLAQESADAS